MASISFPGESAESFANMLQHIAGYTVEIVPEWAVTKPSDDVPTSETFDAVIVGSAVDELHDYYAVRVREYDEEAGAPVGDPFAVVVREIKVY